MRLNVAAAVYLSIIGVSTAAPAGAAIDKKFTNIPAQSLGSALQALAQQRELQVVYLSDVVDNLRTGGATGELSAEDVLKHLLRGTGLSYRYLDDKTVTVMPIGNARSTSSAHPMTGKQNVLAPTALDESTGNDGSGGAGVWASLRSVEMQQAPSSGGGGDSASTNALTEIVVTATRHATAVLDIPQSISAVSGDDLDKNGIIDLAGLAGSFPGISYSDRGPFSGINNSAVVIRGINVDRQGFVGRASTTDPTVATYLDETPVFVNLRLNDLERVEVLEGAQGTLYGSGSLGGTIRYIQREPQLNVWDAKAEVGVGKTQNAASPNDSVSGVVNIPIGETIAIRMDGSFDSEAGFIDQPNLYALNGQGVPIPKNPANLITSPPVTYSEDGTNGYHYQTARVSGLWKPNDDIKVQLSYHHQTASAGGAPYITPGLFGDSLTLADPTRDRVREKIDLGALTIDGNLAFATLTSATSYYTDSSPSRTDFTALYENLYKTYYGANPREIVTEQSNWTDKAWVEELRLASTTTGPVDWVSGLFLRSQTISSQTADSLPGYTDFNNACAAVNGNFNDTCGYGSYYGTANEFNGVPLVKDLSYLANIQSKKTEEALYGEVTWHLTSAWQVTGGVRGYEMRNSTSEQAGLLFVGPAYVSNEARSIDNSGVLGKASIAYHIDKDNLVYALWSQGFRRGGVNALPPMAPNGTVTNPIFYETEPDKDNNYEIGIKGRMPGHLDYSLTAFDVQWTNMQLSVPIGGIGILGELNVGDAYSRGIEAQLNEQITQHLIAQANYSYTKTDLTSLSTQAIADRGPNPINPGLPLPGTPLNQGNLSLEYDHSPVPGFDAFYRVSLNSRSGIASGLLLSSPEAPGVATLSVIAGVQHDQWHARLYVNNLTNRLGITSYTPPDRFGPQGYQALVSTPRTFGLAVGWDLEPK
jgi:iron complex outermembrane recepter protein